MSFQNDPDVLLARIERLEAVIDTLQRRQVATSAGYANFWLTKNDSGSTWSAANSYNMKPWSGTQGAETSDGGDARSVYLRMGDVAANKFCYIGTVNGKLEVIVPQC